ncbi:MAG: hypothetical protein U1F76_28490 [Candidatus Competibacteraceae bacterium]
MPYLVRKVTRAKWDRRDGLAEDEIPADAVTADLRTTNNTLSFWRCAALADDEIYKTVLALATAAERLDRMDIVWVEEDIFRAHSVSLNPSEGRTPVVSLRSKHVDVVKLDLGRLSKVATLLSQALAQGQHRRFTKREVVEIIVAAVHQNLVSVDELEPKVRNEIEKAIAT